jgi:hydroxymethylglutaryl-CoA lyase
MNYNIKLTETPRDGFQGLENIIPTKVKIQYFNDLLKCGFDTLEVGSFVSPKIIPQMADTETVIKNLNKSDSTTKVAVLAVNERGGTKACQLENIDKLFFPFSISETFLKKNINKSIKKSEEIIDTLIDKTTKYNKELVVYYSWGFGNPYGDEWNLELLINSIAKMRSKGLRYFPLSDIDGEATPEKINFVFNSLTKTFPELEFGLHLHSLPSDRILKIEAAFKAGIKNFDTVIGGMGGCPMSGKELVANMDTFEIIKYFDKKGIDIGINKNCILNASTTINNFLFPFQGL